MLGAETLIISIYYAVKNLLYIIYIIFVSKFGNDNITKTCAAFVTPLLDGRRVLKFFHIRT